MVSQSSLGADSGSASRETVIQAQDVSLAYGDTVAVRDVSLSVSQGEFLGLIGPNGSGKTTLLHLLLGMKQPDSGSIELFGEPVEAFDDGSRIGYVPQRSADRGGTMPVTVWETVVMGRFSHAGRSRLSKHDYTVAIEAMERVDIDDLAGRRLGTLSGGQRQRALIARALASNADILALDEPTVGVDAGSRDNFFKLLNNLNQQGMTILLIEHDLEVVTEHVDTVACLSTELYHHGDTHSFLESDAIVEAYGQEINLLRHDHP